MFFFLEINEITIGYVKFKIMTAVRDMELNGCFSKFADNS